jgi:hypothetical protein
MTSLSLSILSSNIALPPALEVSGVDLKKAFAKGLIETG